MRPVSGGGPRVRQVLRIPPSIPGFGNAADWRRWGAELEALWRKDAGARGYEVVADEQYGPAATDYSRLILKAKSNNADALLALPSPPDGMALAKQMKELDYLPKITEFIRAPDGPVWAQNLGKEAITS